jgi:hypothetical protein
MCKSVHTCTCRLPIFNPFLFIRGLFLPRYIRASLSLFCLKLTLPGFPHNCLPVSDGDVDFFKSRPTNGLEIRHPSTRKFDIKQIGPQSAITFCRGLSHPTRWAALPSDNISGRFFHGRRNPLMMQIAVHF